LSCFARIRLHSAWVFLFDDLYDPLFFREHARRSLRRDGTSCRNLACSQGG
jgi:hypothetical protein